MAGLVRTARPLAMPAHAHVHEQHPTLSLSLSLLPSAASLHCAVQTAIPLPSPVCLLVSWSLVARPHSNKPSVIASVRLVVVVVVLLLMLLLMWRLWRSIVWRTAARLMLWPVHSLLKACLVVSRRRKIREHLPTRRANGLIA